MRSFALTVLDPLRFGTLRRVARCLGVGWDLVKDIHKSTLRLLYRSIPLHKVRYLGIDEFGIRIGHEYRTVVTDLRTGRTLHAVEGKGKEEIRPFLKKFAGKDRKRKAVAMDVSSAYFSPVREVLPHVEIVFDRCPILALMNQAIKGLRRKQQRELDPAGQRTLKGDRFLLPSNYEDLRPDRKARLDALLQTDRPLFPIHAMKEPLRLFWEKENLSAARPFPDTWCADALRSGIKQPAKVAKTLAGYRTGLLNYFEPPITSAVVEGINNQIKILKRQAYGFRDHEDFKLRLYPLHTQRHSLAGWTENDPDRVQGLTGFD